MALKIRLRPQGRKNHRVYRLVVSDSRTPRNGHYIETLGWYNPYESEAEKSFQIQPERIQHWLSQGAVLSEEAGHLVKRGAPEVIEQYRRHTLEKVAKACAKKRALRKSKVAN